MKVSETPDNQAPAVKPRTVEDVIAEAQALEEQARQRCAARIEAILREEGLVLAPRIVWDVVRPPGK